MHPPDAQIDKTMHPAIFSYVHSYIKVLIMLNKHAHAGCTRFNIHASGSKNVLIYIYVRQLAKVKCLNQRYVVFYVHIQKGSGEIR